MNDPVQGQGVSDPVLITGASGLVGGALAKRLADERRRLRLVSRAPARLPGREGVEAVGWDGLELAASALAGAAVVVHLAGEPIFGGVPTRARRERMWASRIESTRSLVRRIGELPAGERPRALVCASAVGYYGDRGEEALDETAAPGDGFLADLCVAWEQEAGRAQEHGLRVARLRFAVVLSRAGGALRPLALAFRAGLGGRLGSGRQWFPWIHLDDAVGLLHLALDDARVDGALNAAAPGVVRNADLTREVARAVRRPALLPVPAFAVRLALRDLAGELLGSRRVVPARAAALGYRFAHPELASALSAELGQA
jgi:uncharacterized protein (TIGR01777 family)